MPLFSRIYGSLYGDLLKFEIKGFLTSKKNLKMLLNGQKEKKAFTGK